MGRGTCEGPGSTSSCAVQPGPRCSRLAADEVNTPVQTLLLLYSTAYFVEDTWYCATLPADAFMVGGSPVHALL